MYSWTPLATSGARPLVFRPGALGQPQPASSSDRSAPLTPSCTRNAAIACSIADLSSDRCAAAHKKGQTVGQVREFRNGTMRTQLRQDGHAA